MSNSKDSLKCDPSLLPHQFTFVTVDDEFLKLWTYETAAGKFDGELFLDKKIPVGCTPLSIAAS